MSQANPNTAIGPDPLLPLTQIMGLYGVSFEAWLQSLLSKHAKELQTG